MRGLTVRWSLVDAVEGTEQRLRDYVADTSHEKFSGMAGLCFKTWRMRPGEWFEGCYVFESTEARTRFQEAFATGAADAPGSRLVGSAPVLVEACEIVAVAEGAVGFTESPRGG